MKKQERIGLCTLSTGFNYGSCLQAYAMEQTLRTLGYEPELYRLSGSRIADRDARSGKIFVMKLRSFLHTRNDNGFIGPLPRRSEASLQLFHSFYVNQLKPETVSWMELRRRARRPEYTAFLCGSDQVWNASALYVEPLYYLRFAPKRKRIAYAPSFGSGEIPSWNRTIMKRWINAIPHRSAREEAGQKLIQTLTGKDAPVLPDPVFLMTKEEWIQKFQLTPFPGRYCLACFLNERSEAAEAILNHYRENGYEIIALPYALDDPSVTCVDAGPLEFLRLIYGAEAVATDSFHALAFSILFHRTVYPFSKPGADASGHPLRLANLLQHFRMKDCLDSHTAGSEPRSCERIDAIIEADRQKAFAWLQNTLRSVKRTSSVRR